MTKDHVFSKRINGFNFIIVALYEKKKYRIQYAVLSSDKITLNLTSQVNDMDHEKKEDAFQHCIKECKTFLRKCIKALD